MVRSTFQSFVIIVFFLLSILPSHADGTYPQGIKLDGTIGTAGKIDLPGPDYAIKPEYGKQSGANLFHSFQQFNVHKGESATFSGPDSVKNIISRVTGGSASWIDGKLGSTIPNADLYFLNPAGVMFGANATLDLGGSFHVSTADYLKMGDNERFYAKPMTNEVLSVAAPSAFGFLSDHPAGISAEGSFLSVPNGKTISVIGGDILLHNNTLVAQEGRVNLASAASAGEISFHATGIEMNGIEKQGTIAITRDTDFRQITGTNYSWADITATGRDNGGEIFIRAGRFELRGGLITANIVGDVNGKEINISVTDDVILDGAGIKNGGSISSITSGSGNAGDIAIEAKHLILDNHATIAAETRGIGNGGEIRLNVGDMNMSNVSVISGSSNGVGQGGNIAISAADSVRISSNDSNSGIYAAALNRGAGGKISVDTPDLALDKGGLITADTLGNGNAGEILLNVNNLTLTEKGLVTATTSGGAGHGGNINITAKDTVSISGSGSGIKTSAYKDGDGGNITLSASNLTVDNKSRILAQTLGNGNAGNISAEVNRLTVTGGGLISATTYGSGHGGNISISADDSVNISGSSSGLSTNTSKTGGEGGNIMVKTPVLDVSDGGLISASASGDKKAGEIALNVNKLTMTGGGEIFAVTNGAGQGGDINITADSVNISGINDKGYKSGISVSTLSGTGNAGNIIISASDVSVGKDGSISAFSGGKGNAGEINLNVKTLSLTDGAEISTAVSGQGNGNNINIVAENSVNISGYLGGIYASTYDGGSGGNIMLSTHSMILDEKSKISASTSGTGKAGEIRLNINTLTLAQGAGISASSMGSGDGNNILLKVSDLSIKNESYIQAVSNDTGKAGNIILDAYDTVRLNNSGILTGSLNSDGGDMEFHIGKMLHLSDSYISTSAKGGTGSGGNILIDPQFVILNNSKIFAQAYGGSGGNIRIVADNFIRTWTSVVDASSKLGINGLVEIDSPDTNISGGLTILPGNFFDATQWAASTCDERSGKIRGRFEVRTHTIRPEPFGDQP